MRTDLHSIWYLLSREMPIQQHVSTVEIHKISIAIVTALAIFCAPHWRMFCCFMDKCNATKLMINYPMKSTTKILLINNSQCISNLLLLLQHLYDTFNFKAVQGSFGVWLYLELIPLFCFFNTFHKMFANSAPP